MERKGGDDDDASPYHEDVEDDRGYEHDQRRAGQVLRTRPRHDSTVAEKFLLFGGQSGRGKEGIVILTSIYGKNLTKD